MVSSHSTRIQQSQTPLKPFDLGFCPNMRRCDSVYPHTPPVWRMLGNSVDYSSFYPVRLVPGDFFVLLVWYSQRRDTKTRHSLELKLVARRRPGRPHPSQWRAFPACLRELPVATFRRFRFLKSLKITSARFVRAPTLALPTAGLPVSGELVDC